MRNIRQGRPPSNTTGGGRSSSSFAACAPSWKTLDEFLLGHVAETLLKLIEGRHERDGRDDRIWGKLILMEGRSLLAKLYLRNSVIVVDGGEEEFDGRTIGFNHFRRAPMTNDAEDLCGKIADGVILKISSGSGNLKAMALGTTPIYALDMEMDEASILPGGRLPPRTPLEADSARVVKLFDAHRFKRLVDEYDPSDAPQEHLMELFRRVCVRIAMVKRIGGGWDKLPAWFLLININALEMLARGESAAYYECKYRELISKARMAELQRLVLKSMSGNNAIACDLPMPKPLTTAFTTEQSLGGSTEGRTEMILAKMLADALDRVAQLQTTILEKALNDNAAVMGSKQPGSSIPSSIDVDLNQRVKATRIETPAVMREARERRRSRPPLTHTLFRKPLMRENDESIGGSASTSDYDGSSKCGIEEDISVSGGHVWKVENSASSASWEEGENDSPLIDPPSAPRTHLAGYYYCEEEELDEPASSPQNKRSQPGRSLPRIRFSGHAERY